MSDDQRRSFRRKLFSGRVDRIRRDRARFALTVGARVPRHHRLHRLTPALFAFAPYYQGYSYVVVDDTICIVDPDTYTVVDVIPASLERAEGPPVGPRLALTEEEMRFVSANVPRDDARTDVSLRLALGAEIPRRVELYRFPEEVLAALPQLQEFRYIVAQGDDVVIVDPADYEIALVIPQ